jgi:hypothetical protein
MKPTKTILVFLFTLVLLVTGKLLHAQTLVPENPDCCDLKEIDGLHDPIPDNSIGFKVDLGGTEVNGTWLLDASAEGTLLTCLVDGFTGDPSNSITITTIDGLYFDWSSTLALDAIIVKGGPDAHVYYYDPESTGDVGLHAPINPSNGNPYEISHIEFCFDYELGIAKTAFPTFTRTFSWTISKSVTPDQWDLFVGDDGTSEYTVSVDKTGFTDNNWAVNGTITIENNTPFDVVVGAISDVVVDGLVSDPNTAGGTALVPDCGISFPYTLASGASFSCTYASSLNDASDRTNIAKVTVAGELVEGAYTLEPIIFGDPTALVNDEVNVTDTNGESWGPVSDDASWTYMRTFTCGEDNTYLNTASIVETGDSDDATVEVNCYELTVTKDASTSLTRTWDWTIDKSADQTDLNLMPGQQFLVNYAVNVDAAYTDSDWATAGGIYVTNSAPIPAVINSLTDIISGGIAGIVDCAIAFPYTLAPGNTLTCTYSAALADDATRTNTGTATLQNYAYDKDGVATENGTTDYSGIATVDFAGATITEVDECVDVTDTHVGSLGTVCAEALPASFYYSIWVGPYSDPDDCGEQTVDNTASFVTNDRGYTGSDSWTVNVLVPCDYGCTLTLGYWKTHSEYGPAPYDDTWALLTNGADEPFFISGQTWFEVLWTPPAGNVYYILAPQYIAAALNFLNGADPSAAQTAFDEAEGLLQNNTPEETGSLKGQAKKEWTDLATILDDYNNGIIGPGHCSEEEEIEDKSSPVLTGTQETTGSYSLEQNYPNPFSNTTNIIVRMPETERVDINVYSLLGQKVSNIFSGNLEEGTHTFTYTIPATLPEGVYVYTLEANGVKLIKKMNVIR